MPNYVKNQITFDCSEEEFQEILNIIKRPDGSLGTFDFNSIIKMPDELDIMAGTETTDGYKIYSKFLEEYKEKNNISGDININDIDEKSEKEYLKKVLDNTLKEREDRVKKQWELGKQATINIKKYGYATWYDWRLIHWGVKWNALESYILENENVRGIQFETAWSPPLEVIEEMSRKFSDIPITIEWADEVFGNTCGRIRYEDGNLLEDYFPENEKEMAKIYCKIHDVTEEWLFGDSSEEVKTQEKENTQEKVGVSLEDSYDKTILENLSKTYSKDTRIELIEMGEDPNPIPPNTRGSVICVDDLGQVHVRFDNGRTLAVIPGEDSFRPLTTEEILEENLSQEESIDKKDIISEKLNEFSKDLDTYENIENSKSQDKEKTFLENKDILDNENDTLKLRNRLKGMTNELTDKKLLNEANDIIADLEELLEGKTDEKTKDLTKRQNERREKLNKEVLEVAQSFVSNPDDLFEFFDFQNKFYGYSMRNRLLIYNQNPHATFCASYNEHKKQGHPVKKGQHGMKILVPVKKTYLKLENGKSVNLQNATDEQKKAYEQGKIEGKTYQFYKAGTVFDISQTNCPIEDYPKTLDIGYPSEKHKALFNILKEYCETKLDCKVIEDAFSSVSIRGEYNPKKNTIELSGNFNDTTKLSALSHEMGHALLHNDNTKAIDKRPMCQIEFEADAVSIMLSKKLGVDISSSRQEHFSNTLKNMNKLENYTPEMVEESLHRANKAYTDVAKEIDKSFSMELNQTQNIQNKVTQANDIAYSSNIPLHIQTMS